MSTVTLYRPIGAQELALIEASGWREFPPRLPSHPIFHPVTSEAYAREIARDRNVRQTIDGLGFVTRFSVKTEFLAAYELHRVGDPPHEEYWIPADDLPALNAAIENRIKTIAAYTDVDGEIVDIQKVSQP